ncbi:hypothetical protein GWK47_003684 [Chionoecetes opilio]|uniref:Uncharacterized protein n=1 Tax=Chionoecetes opilio TaxID=41210 RepID=A0A8J4YKM6_CHIOP|nr:hypothetical protein GWK47_003684 [Chionoecetes opilio]
MGMWYATLKPILPLRVVSVEVIRRGGGQGGAHKARGWAKLMFPVGSCLALISPGPTTTEGTNLSHPPLQKMGEKELESWCSEKQRNKMLAQAMFPALSHAAWVDVFVKYNTAIPSSAAVKTVIPGVRHHEGQESESDSKNFERLVFMKGNMDLLKMEISPEDSE